MIGLRKTQVSGNISRPVYPEQTIFTSQTPAVIEDFVGGGELGIKFQADIAGEIRAIKYWRSNSPVEPTPHTGRIWSSSGVLLASVLFASETSSGWQRQNLTTPLAILANTIYVVSVNANSYYGVTTGELNSPIVNGNLRTIAGETNGVSNSTAGQFPTEAIPGTTGNYFRDVVFVQS
jgi:hypothetical protein